MILSGERDVTFDSGHQKWNPCRAYSVNATIMDELGNYSLFYFYDLLLSLTSEQSVWSELTSHDPL